MMADRRTILAMLGFRWLFSCWRSDFGAAIDDASVDSLDEAAWLEATTAWWQKQGLRIGTIPDYP
jgi:hypothetical protein